jgi:hypothetical protein
LNSQERRGSIVGCVAVTGFVCASRSVRVGAELFLCGGELPLSGEGALFGTCSPTGLLPLTLPLGAGDAATALAILVSVRAGEVVADDDDDDDDSEADEVPKHGAGAGVTVHGVTGNVGGVPHGREREDVVHDGELTLFLLSVKLAGTDFCRWVNVRTP